MTIKDGGTRREFETGAVRDIQEGKGRCDLMPLREVAFILSDDPIVTSIADFMLDGDPFFLKIAIRDFSKYFENPYDMFLEVAIHFEQGALKYGENNWQKGIPVHCYIDSAVRHYLKYRRGDIDEPHNRAFVWNLLCAIWTCENKPELNEYKKGDEQP